MFRAAYLKPLSEEVTPTPTGMQLVILILILILIFILVQNHYSRHYYSGAPGMEIDKSGRGVAY